MPVAETNHEAQETHAAPANNKLTCPTAPVNFKHQLTYQRAGSSLRQVVLATPDPFSAPLSVMIRSPWTDFMQGLATFWYPFYPLSLKRPRVGYNVTSVTSSVTSVTSVSSVKCHF